MRMNSARIRDILLIRDLFSKNSHVVTDLSRVQNSDRIIDLAFKLPRFSMLRIEFESLIALTERVPIMTSQIQSPSLLETRIRQSPVFLPRLICRRRILLTLIIWPPITRVGVFSRRRYGGGWIRRWRAHNSR